MTEETQEIKSLIRELKADVASQIGALSQEVKELDAKVSKASDFQTVFLGAVKILTALVIIGAGVATIYVAVHGGSSK